MSISNTQLAANNVAKSTVLLLLLDFMIILSRYYRVFSPFRFPFANNMIHWWVNKTQLPYTTELYYSSLHLWTMHTAQTVATQTSNNDDLYSACPFKIKHLAIQKAGRAAHPESSSTRLPSIWHKIYSNTNKNTSNADILMAYITTGYWKLGRLKLRVPRLRDI